MSRRLPRPFPCAKRPAPGNGRTSVLCADVSRGPGGREAAWRLVLALPKVRWLLSATVPGRLAYGMLPVVVFLVLLAAAGSVGWAAGLTAAHGLVSAVLFPWKGRLVDRFGRRVLRAMTATTVALLTGTAFAVWTAAPGAVVFAGLALAAVFSPPVTSTVRAIWGRTLDGKEDLRTHAFAVDAGMEEVTFLAGPALGGISVQVLGSGWTLLVVGALFAVSLTILTSLMPGNLGLPPVRVPGRESRRLTASTRLIGALMTTDALAQGLIGASIAVLATQQRSSGLYGLLLTLDGVGAFLGVVMLGRLTRGRTQGWRVRALCLTSPWLMTPLLVSNTPVPLMASVLVLGLPLAALSATLNSAVSTVEEPGRWNEAYSWLVTGQNLGGAAGFATGGLIAGLLGAHGPAVIAVVVAVVSLLVLVPCVVSRITGATA